MIKCKYCESITMYEVFKPFKNPAYKTFRDPKFAFHISQKCFDCHKHQGFLKQTEELINKLNNSILMQIDLENRS